MPPYKAGLPSIAGVASSAGPYGFVPHPAEVDARTASSRASLRLLEAQPLADTIAERRFAGMDIGSVRAGQQAVSSRGPFEK